MGIDLTKEEIEEVISDPVKWARGEKEKKAVAREDAEIAYRRTLEDLHNYHYMRMFSAYKELVKAGIINEGDDPPWGVQKSPKVVY